MSFWKTFVEYQPLEWAYRAATGQPSPVWKSANDAETADMIRRAGGTEQQAKEAIDEVNDFMDEYWPPRTPVGTLWDDLKGDPLGLGRAPDAKNRAGNSDFTFAILIVVAVLIFIFLADAFFG